MQSTHRSNLPIRSFVYLSAFMSVYRSIYRFGASHFSLFMRRFLYMSLSVCLFPGLAVFVSLRLSSCLDLPTFVCFFLRSVADERGAGHLIRKYQAGQKWPVPD